MFIEESIVLNFFFTLIQKFQYAYQNSSTAKVVALFVRLFKKFEALYKSSLTASIMRKSSSKLKDCITSSKTWYVFQREGFLARWWKYSLFYILLEGIFNLPSKLFGRIFLKWKAVFMESIGFRFLQRLLARFEIIWALALAAIIIIPDARWTNLYSIAAILGILSLYILKTIVDRRETFKLHALDFLFAIFITMGILATVTSLVPASSMKILLLYMTCFLFVLTLVSSIKTSRELSTVIEVMLIAITLSSLYGIWQLSTGAVQVNPSFTDLRLNEGAPPRLIGTMGNPNNFAELLVLTIPFFFAVILNTKSFFKKAVYTALAIPPLVALVFTISRSGWIAFAVAMFIVVFFKNRKLIPLFVFIGLLAVPFLPDWVYRRITTIWNPHDTSASFRKEIWSAIEPMMRKCWDWGLGLGSEPFMRTFTNYFQGSIPAHSHNLFLQVWIETGIIGILSFLWFIARTFKNAFLRIIDKKDMYTNHILIAGMAAVSGVLVTGLVEHVWFYHRIMLFFWVDIAIILTALRVASKEQGSPTPESKDS